MGLFKKKKMIDVGELQRRGRMRIPRQDVNLDTDNEGFVDFSKSSNTPTQNNFLDSSSTPSSTPAPSNFNSFFDMTASNSPASSSTSTSSSDNYSKRELDAKLESLDNKLYKLEQRLEVIERKLGVGVGSSTGGLW